MLVLSRVGHSRLLISSDKLFASSRAYVVAASVQSLLQMAPQKTSVRTIGNMPSSSDSRITWEIHSCGLWCSDRMRNFHISPDRGMTIIWFNKQKHLDAAFPPMTAFQQQIAERVEGRVEALKGITSPESDFGD